MAKSSSKRRNKPSVRRREAFYGSRKDFLMGEKALYAAAFREGYGAEAISSIQRRFFKRYPIDLPENEEPTAEFLAAVDDDTPDEEVSEPDAQRLTQEEYLEAVKRLDERKKLVAIRKAQIKRWLIYQYSKDNTVKKKTNIPWGSFLQQLTGKETHKPRLRTGVNVWRKTQRDAIDKRYEELAAAALARGQPLKSANLAADRDKIAREMFAALSQDEQKQWIQMGKEEHAQAMAAYNKELNAGPSTLPEDRQRAIEGIAQFLEPIINMICEATGWKITVLAGGPEPARNGSLNVISIHAGLTSGDVKMNFGQSERKDYKTHIIPIFGSFLQKCYSPEECRARALPQDGTIPLDSGITIQDDSDADASDLEPSVGTSTAAAPAPAPAPARVAAAPAAVIPRPIDCANNGGASARIAAAPVVVAAPTTTTRSVVSAPAAAPAAISMTASAPATHLSVSREESAPPAYDDDDDLNPFPVTIAPSPRVSLEPALPTESHVAPPEAAGPSHRGRKSQGSSGRKRKASTTVGNKKRRKVKNIELSAAPVSAEPQSSGTQRRLRSTQETSVSPPGAAQNIASTSQDAQGSLSISEAQAAAARKGKKKKPTWFYVNKVTGQPVV